MKKVLLFACAVAAMASCAKTEVVDINLDDPNIIGFSTYVGATRADVTSANIISGDGVGVFAVENGTTFSSTASFHIPNAKLSGVGTDNTNTVDPTDGFGVATDSQWSTSSSYYWPVNNALDFYAYYPFVGTDGLAAFDTTTNYVDATSSAEGEWEIAATADAQEDYLAGIVTNKTVDDGTVMLELNHLLSKVDFQVGVESENSGAILAVTINSIKLEGIADEHQGLDLSVPELKAASTVSYNGAYTYAAADEPTTAEANIVLAQTTTSDLYSVTDNVLTDAARFNSANTGYVLPGATNTTASYADINSGTATTGAESFKLLPQTLVKSGDDVTGSPFQRVTLNYSVTQNGYDIVGSGDIKYKYTVVFWSVTGAETTSGLTAGTAPSGDLTGADGSTSYAADTDNTDAMPSVAFSGDDEITATITYPTTALTGSEYSYLISGDNAVTYAQLQALKAALETATGASTAGCNGYSIVWAVDSDATTAEGGVVTNNSVTFDLYTSEVTAWKPGCSYIYTILFAGANNGLGGGTDGSIVDLGATKIYFDVMVNDWASATTDELENEAQDYVEN